MWIANGYVVRIGDHDTYYSLAKGRVKKGALGDAYVFKTEWVALEHAKSIRAKENTDAEVVPVQVTTRLPEDMARDPGQRVRFRG